MRVTRLAPSPTGALHLGNARTFLVNWLLARQNGWKIILRIEDLDGPRIKAGADRQAIEDLAWLGLNWDQGPFYQSPRINLYKQSVQQLLARQQAYFCVCSRKEVDSAASAPHAEDGSTRYPGTCRNRFASRQQALAHANRPPAIRFRAPDQTVEFVDRFRGLQRYNVLQQLGDFVIAKADETAAYQLAVVLDDAEMGVTDVVRGDDLLDSTPRQILLYHALGLSHRIPDYYHLPLIVGPDGRRLAKRHGDTRLAFYREQGVNPRRLLSLLARWCGMTPPPLATPAELLDLFNSSNIPPKQLVFTPADDLWLRQ